MLLRNGATWLKWFKTANCPLTTVLSSQVLSGSNWGNLLLWDGNAIKVEICSKGGHCCHAGVVQPFALEDGQLMTFGSDGMIRVTCGRITRRCAGVDNVVTVFPFAPLAGVGL